MKQYIAILIQLMIWSIFSIAEWFSANDHLVSKIILFIIFFFFAYIITKKLVKSVRLTILVTMLSLFSYSVIKIFILFATNTI